MELIHNKNKSSSSTDNQLSLNIKFRREKQKFALNQHQLINSTLEAIKSNHIASKENLSFDRETRHNFFN